MTDTVPTTYDARVERATVRRGRPRSAMTVPIDPTVPPSGTGNVECLAGDGWWLNLRRCAACGHIGCCDSSPSQHASRDAAETGHTAARSFEPGEDWFWDDAAGEPVEGVPELAPPLSRPLDQPRPGPAGRVPADWEDRLNEWALARSLPLAVRVPPAIARAGRGLPSAHVLRCPLLP